MFKKIGIIFIFSLSLSSCFDSTVVESWESIQSLYENKNFSISIPSKWKVIKNTDKILPQPADWEVVFDAVSETSNNNFYRNILVLKQEITNNISSLDYIIWNYIWSKKEYFYINQLDEQNVLIDWQKTKVYEFEARYSEDTPILKFVQTWVICGKTGYILTISLEKNNVNSDRYEGLLWTFKCKK